MRRRNYGRQLTLCAKKGGNAPKITPTAYYMTVAASAPRARWGTTAGEHYDGCRRSAVHIKCTRLHNDPHRWGCARTTTTKRRTYFTLFGLKFRVFSTKKNNNNNNIVLYNIFDAAKKKINRKRGKKELYAHYTAAAAALQGTFPSWPLK